MNHEDGIPALDPFQNDVGATVSAFGALLAAARKGRLVRILSRDPINMLSQLHYLGLHGHGGADWNAQGLPEQIWLGVEVEDQRTAEERIPLLLLAPAKRVWVYVRETRGPIDLLAVHKRSSEALNVLGRLNLIVVNNEPSMTHQHQKWISDLSLQCRNASIPYLLGTVCRISTLEEVGLLSS